MSDLGGPNDSWYGVAVSPDKKWLYLAGFKGVATDGAGNDDAVFARAALSPLEPGPTARAGARLRGASASPTRRATASL